MADGPEDSTGSGGPPGRPRTAPGPVRRSRTARALASMVAAVLVGGLAIAFPLSGAAAPAGAAAVAVAPRAAAVPTTATSGGRSLVANPTTDLAVNGAQITVSGSGFSPASGGIFVAVCTSAQTAGGVRPGDCVGGPRPNASLNRDYAHFVDPTRTGGPGGGVTAPLTNGEFTQYTLTLTSATGTPNCQTQPCSVWAFSDDESDPSQDISIPLAFVAPPTSSSPTSSSPTSTSPTAPSTATVASVATQDVAAGAQQTVVFTGFQPNEVLGVELFPPTSTQAITPPGTFGSDGNGNATIAFTVPSTVSPGAVRLQVTGRSSGTVGVAEFQVTAPPTTASSTPASTTSSSPTSSSTPASSSAPASSTPATSSSAAPTPTPTSSGSSLWWLWLLLAILVIAGIITGIVLWRRKQQQDREREQQQRDVEAAAAQQQASERDRALGQQPTQAYPPPTDPYGLLSGRDPADYGQGPTEYLPPGQGPRTQGWPPPSNAPTQFIPPPGSQDQTRYIPPAPPRGPAGPPGSDAPTQFVPPYQPPGQRPTTPQQQPPQQQPPQQPPPQRPDDADRTQTWRPGDDDDQRGGPRR